MLSASLFIFSFLFIVRVAHKAIAVTYLLCYTIFKYYYFLTNVLLKMKWGYIYVILSYGYELVYGLSIFNL